MKIEKLTQMLDIYEGSTDNFLMFISQCNREGLINTTIEYKNDHGFIIFSAEAQVAENLVNFGNQLRDVFNKVEE